MRRILTIFCLSVLLINASLAQNQIIAGQTSGNNIHYTDFEPDSSVQLINGGEGFLLDIDKNNINDLGFYVLVEDVYMWYTKFWSSITTINNNVKILSDGGFYNLVYNLNVGDTISALQNWSPTYDSTYELEVQYNSHYPPPGSTTYYGYLGTGYLGFKIEYPTETFYGWIYLSATYESIAVMEMAINGLSVSVEKPENKVIPVRIFPNPCQDELYLEIDIKRFENLQFKIINSLGKIVRKGAIVVENSKINTAGLESGFYIMQIQERGCIVERIKFIKAIP